MVLGLRSKNKRPTSMQVDYTIHIQDIKPWPPSQSLKSLKSVVLQWENGGRTLGSTGPVAPSQSKIEFNEKFNMHATLLKESSGKGGGFQKNVLELSLYEPRRDKALKGQLLGNALVDLGECGVVKDAVCIGVPLNCKRSYRNTAQPVVYVKIRLLDKEKSLSTSSSFKDDSLSKESVSALMSEEYEEEEETEIASFTDDDVVSSHSSHGNLASATEAGDPSSRQQQSQDHHENEPDAENENKMANNLSHETVPKEQELEQTTTVPDSDNANVHQHNSLPQSLSKESSIDLKSLDNGDSSFSTLPVEKPNALATCSSSSSPISKSVQQKVVCSESKINVAGEPQKTDNFDNQIEMPKPVVTAESELTTKDKISTESRDDSYNLEEKIEVVQNHSIIESLAGSSPNGSIVSRDGMEQTPIVHDKYLQNALRKQVNSDLNNSSQKLLGEMGRRSLSNDRLKNMQFTRRSPPHSLGLSGRLRYTSNDHYVENVKKIDVSQKATSNSGGVKHSFVPGNKVQKFEVRVEKLEAELREAAAIEISLYSIVAEHGSSARKVHTPARRLSRLYIHASEQWSRERKASAARSIVSGLVLVAKACGNDVPRLTFWLSNSIVLRTIVTRTLGHSGISVNVDSHSAANGLRFMAKGKSSPLKWASHRYKKEILSFTKASDDWENLSTFTDALERIESWTFSRIVESLWWQTLILHMQSADELGSGPQTGLFKKNKNIDRKLSLGNKNNENFSIEIWKKAFHDACERLCPLRAEGHECGCLPMLAKLVMEQCIARLDVAMLNAVLRDSDDEMPTDPMSDPVCNPKVLPIPQGKLSFGDGAQLKNVIGTWSRWLTGLFGMDMDESPQGKNEQDDGGVDAVETFKSFCLLNALSDLLMLPKDMLLQKSIRKEVCPTFSSSMIKRILDRFSPDEFCPDPIPDEVLEALDSEDPSESNVEEIGVYPYNAPRMSYLAPSVASIENIIGDVRSTPVLRRSGSSVIRKCHTSDDELDELDSPLASIMLENSSSPPARMKNNGRANFVRYQLLHDAWRSDD